MKTKNKIFALVEIAIVLCLVFLVALPAIAAEQTTQEVSAAEVTTASEDDYVLGIYGNANEDDTIDMRDLTYVKLIFFGKKPETELADAKYDGKINPLDFIQIKLIIVGKEKELTISQYLGYSSPYTKEPMTVHMPIERIVAICSYAPEALCTIGVQDKIVAVAESAKKRGELEPLMRDKTIVCKYGDSREWDMEKILELEPDVVLGFAFWGLAPYEDHRETLEAVGIQLVQMDFHNAEKFAEEMSILGWMLKKQDKVEELINFDEENMNLIEERVSGLEDEEKVHVYYSSAPYYYGPTKTCGGCASGKQIELSGGINIFADTEGYVTVDLEEIIVRNPDVIYAGTWSGASTGALGYDITDTASVEKVRNETFMEAPGWDVIDAVKNGRVYFIAHEAASTHSSIICLYLAKFFYPERFEGIDPVEIHREWMERFLGVEYQGVYAYPTYPV